MRASRLLILALLVGAPSARAESLFVPYVRTMGAPYWQSRLSIFNGGRTAGTAHVVAIYGSGAALIDAEWCEADNGLTLPNGGHHLLPCVAERPSSGVAFLEIVPDPGILLRGDVYRSVDYMNICVEPSVTTVPLARWPLPVFRRTFDAGATVVTGPIGLGNLGCAPSGREYPRRVNLTLFNAGTENGTFQITTRAYDDALGPPIHVQTVSVAAKDVVQVNGVQSAYPAAALHGDPEVRVWMSITADQPFLTYASAIFNVAPDGQPPFEVFEVYAPSSVPNDT